jgi:cytochrome c oxidase assembly protein subunit 15
MRRFAWTSLIAAILSFPLIGLGAIVRLKGAGLACPDWPLCYGRVTPLSDVVAPPPEGFKIALEVGHRYWAGAVGLIVIGLWGYAFKNRSTAKWRTPFWIATLSLGLLIPQAVLGGLTVIYDLSPVTVSLHLLFGHFFFGALIVQSLVSFRRAQSESLDWLVDVSNSRYLRRWFTGAFLFLCLQIFVGGWVSSTHAGMACPDFPTCLGSFAFPDGWGPGIQYTHRLVGFSLALVIIGACIKGYQYGKDRLIGHLAAGGVVLVVLQILVGWYNVEYYIPVPTSALHTMIATTMFALMVFLTFLSWAGDIRVNGDSVA